MKFVLRSCEMFTFWDILYEKKEKKKNGKKLSRARSTYWKSSLILPTTNFETKKVYEELPLSENVNSVLHKI